MQRLIYDENNKKIIEIIDPCDNTVTGTPFSMFEGTPEEVAQLILDLNLSTNK